MMTVRSHSGNLSAFITMLPTLEILDEQPPNRQRLMYGCRFFVVIAAASYPLVI